jgi:CelD/BcsL family acetyltransferase involved in cellulose biosynthesis
MAVPARHERVRPVAADAGAGLGVTIARSIEDVEALRPTWLALQEGELTSDIDYFLTLARFHPEIRRPHVLVLERDGEPVTLLAAHLHEGWLVHRIGPWAAYKPTLRSVNVVYRGILGERSPETIASLLRSLQGTLDDREADTVLLRYLEPGCDVHLAAVSSEHFRRREHFLPRRPHWSMTIDGSLEETLSRRSAKTRENVRRVCRRIEREFGDRLRLDVLRDATDAPRIFADVDRVAATAYQHESGTFFQHSELERQLVLLGLGRGWYRAHVLSVDERPIAFWTGFSYGGTFGWRGATGYDPAFGRFSPGTYVLVQLLDDLSRDPGVRLFDIGGGDVEYKRYFGDRRWEEIDVRVLGPGARNLAVSAIGSSVQALHQGLRHVGAAGGQQGSASRLQRKRLKRRAGG